MSIGRWDLSNEPNQWKLASVCQRFIVLVLPISMVNFLNGSVIVGYLGRILLRIVSSRGMIWLQLLLLAPHSTFVWNLTGSVWKPFSPKFMATEQCVLQRIYTCLCCVWLLSCLVFPLYLWVLCLALFDSYFERYYRQTSSWIKKCQPAVLKLLLHSLQTTISCTVST